ncbi:putative beta-lysine N-acetyltransferase [bacterium]|nr:putative beta-lysine N-acetyltransferase [bacterium]
MRTVNSPFDTIEKLRHSLIQHGPSSDRIYLMKLNAEDYPGIITELVALAEEKQYGKIFAKVPSQAMEGFLHAGFAKEAEVPGFYTGTDDAIFLGRYLKEERRQVEACLRRQMEDIVALARRKAAEEQADATSTAERAAAEALPFTLRRLGVDDAAQLTRLYGTVFESYPFPIFEREYIVHTMEEDSIAYYGALTDDGRLVAASSAEMDKAGRNAEMTDFATHPDARGHGIALHLLRLMEADMQSRGMIVLYTIARAVSTGMNVTFGKGGYEYTGTLINNTNISGRIENMNVWYKRL